MDNYRLILLKNDRQFNITPLASNLSWSDSIETLGTQLSFDVARNTKDRYMVNYDLINVQDKVLLSNNGIEVFRGIITDVTTEGLRKKVTAFDYAFLLNQSKTIKQFNRITASDGVRQLCNQFNIPIGSIVLIPTLISKIYKDKTIAEIIKDILNQATRELGIRYRLEMRAGKLHIEKYTDLIVKGTFQPAYNIAPFDVEKAIGEVNKQESIQDMKNCIVVTSYDEKSTRVLAKAEDLESIAETGLLQELVSVDNKDTSQANNIAQKKLKLLDRITENISVPLMGDDRVRSGRIINLESKMFNLAGTYLVKACTHTYQNGIHRMTVGVESVVVS